VPILSVPDPKLLGAFRDAPAAPLAEDGHVSEARRLVRTLELIVSGDTIEGRIGPERGESQSFSGWSELFALLQSMTSEGGSDSRGDTQETGTAARSPTVRERGP
jgi:hypothetical protein